MKRNIRYGVRVGTGCAYNAKLMMMCFDGRRLHFRLRTTVELARVLRQSYLQTRYFWSINSPIQFACTYACLGLGLGVRGGVRVQCSVYTYDSDFLYYHSVHNILPIIHLCTPQGFITCEVIIDIIFWSDIGISFRTSYRENGKEVFDADLIAKRYLRY